MRSKVTEQMMEEWKFQASSHPSDEAMMRDLEEIRELQLHHNLN